MISLYNLWIIFSGLLTACISGLVLAIIAKYADKSLFGYFMFFNSISGFFVIFFAGGVSIFYQSLKSQNNILAVHKYFSIFFKLSLFITLGVLIFYKSFNNFWLAILILISFLPAVMSEYILAIFKKNQSFLKIIIFSPILNLIKLIFLLYFLFTNALDLNEEIISEYLISYVLLSGIIFFWILKKTMIFSNFSKLNKFEAKKSKTEFKKIILKVIPYSSYSVIHFLFYATDIFYLKLYVDFSVIGDYSFAFSLFSFLLIPITSLYQKKYVQKIFNMDKLQLLKSYNNLLKLIFGSLVMIVLGFLVSDQIFLYFNGKYDGAKLVFYLFLVNIPIVALSTHYGAYLNFAKLINRKLKILIIALFLNVTLNVIFIPFYLDLGAIFATTSSNILLTILFYHYSKRFINE